MAPALLEGDELLVRLCLLLQRRQSEKHNVKIVVTIRTTDATRANCRLGVELPAIELFQLLLRGLSVHAPVAISSSPIPNLYDRPSDYLFRLRPVLPSSSPFFSDLFELIHPQTKPSTREKNKFLLAMSFATLLRRYEHNQAARAIPEAAHSTPKTRCLPR